MAMRLELVYWTTHGPYRGWIVDHIETDDYEQRFVLHGPDKRVAIARRWLYEIEFRYEEVPRRWHMKVRYGCVSWELLPEYLKWNYSKRQRNRQ